MRNPVRMRLLGAFALGVVALAAAACGGGDDPTATSTQPATTSTQPPATATQPAPGGTTTPVSGTPTSALPTATATSTPSSNLGDLPAPENPAGTIVVVIQNLNSSPGINSAQGGETVVLYGAGESLFTTAVGPEFGLPWLAKEWELSDDLTYVDITLQEGVQFHRGYGEMTAEDVAWSLNDANATTNPESIHAQAGDLAAIWGEAEVIDTYVVRLPFVLYDPRWQTNGLSDGFQVTGIFSKKVFDEMGRDWMLENNVMTGPFEVRHWLQGDNATLDAVDEHWRKVPEIDTITYRVIPDAAVRQTQLETGEADAGALELADIRPLTEAGFALTGTGNGTELNIAMAGNLWETEDRNGNPLDRPGLDPSKPWIGDPADEESMEKARLVRWALATSIDRTALKEVLTADFGWEQSIGYFNDQMPQFQDKWAVEYDVDAAKQFLIDAGYPDGFPIQIFGQADTLIRAETAEAVGAMWAQELGLDVEVQSYQYSVFRPSIVDRSANIPFMNSCDDGRFPRPWDWPVGLVTSSLSRGGFSCGLEAPLITEKWLEVANEPDITRRVEINNEVADYMHHWMLMPGTVTVPVLLVYNPRSIAQWDMRPSLGGPIGSPENIVLGPR